MPASLPFALVIPFLCVPASTAQPSSAHSPFSRVASRAPTAAFDDAEESYQFIVGLSEKGMHSVLVREARNFLKAHPRHRMVEQVRYRLATSLFDEGEFEAARVELSKLAGLRGFAFASEVDFRLGQCELERGDQEAALAAFERVIAADSEYLLLPATFLAAEAAFRSADFERAEVGYKKVLASDGQEYLSDAAFGLCWCAYKQHDFEVALSRIAAFAREHKRDPRVGELHFIAGECQLESGRYEKALAEYGRVPAGASADAALRGSAFACAALKRHAQAARHFQDLLASYPDSRFAEEAALQAGIQLLQAGDARGALGALSYKKLAGGPELYLWKARCQAKLDEPQKALALLDRALSHRSLQGKRKDAEREALIAQLQVARGDALFDLGRGAEAAAAYGRSGSDYALHAAAVARLNDGQAEDALRLIRPVASKADGTYRMEALLTQGEALFALERYEEALPSFEAVRAESERADHQARALARAGWCLFELERHEQAASRFKEVADSHPECSFAPEALFMHGRASEESGQAAQAQASFGAYLKAFRGGSHALEAGLRLARFEPGNAGEARLQRLLAEDPDSELAPQAYYDLAERQSADGRHGISARNYRAIIENFPEDPLAGPAGYGLAWGLYSQERYEEAALRLRELLSGDKVAAELELVALELSVFAERRSGAPEAAVRAFEAFSKICADEGRRLRAAKVAAAALRDGGALGQAQQLFAQLLRDTKQGPVAISICVERAYLALDQKDTVAAEKQLRVALPYAKEDADLAEAFFFVGEAWFAAGEDQRAADSYKVASTSPSTDVAARALYKRGFAFLRSEQNAAAASAFEALVTSHPGNPFVGEALFLWGESLFRDGQFAQALAPLKRVTSEFPRHEVLPKALFRLGLGHAHSGEWESAQTRLAKLIKLFPDFPSRDEAELWRGRALMQMGNRRAARTAFKGVTSRDDGILSAQAHLEIGKLAKAEGDLESALSSYLKVSVLYSHQEEVGEALFLAGRVLEQQGKPARAREQYQELLERTPGCSHGKNARERLAILQ